MLLLRHARARGVGGGVHSAGLSTICRVSAGVAAAFASARAAAATGVPCRNAHTAAAAAAPSRTSPAPRPCQHTRLPQRSVHTTITAASSIVSDDASSAAWPPASDTVYQLCSGLGRGQAVGVAIIRISGPLALAALLALTGRTQAPKSRTATRTSLYKPKHDEHTASLIRDTHAGRVAPSSVAHAPTSASPADPSRLIDSDILALWFPSPASFTGEDVVELHVHGTPLIVNGVFAALEALNRTTVERLVTGKVSPALTAVSAEEAEDPSTLSLLSSLAAYPPLLRLATPGEFTRRAFQHGKLDLTQVEALGDLLSAETERQKAQALVQMRGELGRFYAQWRLDLLNSLAYIEAVLDFSEDEQDVGESEILANVLPKVRDIARSLEAHLADHRRGELTRSGVAIVIVGSPNAGKSTLLNALAQRQVAIVSPVPGTTRDIVENRLNIAGWPCILADTAGLREIRRRRHDADVEAASADALLSGHDLIEAEGMKRTHERTAQADLKLVLLDASQLLQPDAALDPQVLALIDRTSIVVWTKMDLVLAEAAANSAAVTSAPSVSSSASAPASPSASTTGRAKLRTAAKFYADSRDSFTSSEVDLLKQVASRSAAYERVAEKASRMVFLACPSQVAAASESTTPTNKGVQHLLTAIEQQIQGIVGLDAPGGSVEPETATGSSLPLITRHRHRVHVESCLTFLQIFESYMAREGGGDLVLAAEQLRLATREIGKITGRVDVEELLDVIFEDFCIGK